MNCNSRLLFQILVIASLFFLQSQSSLAAKKSAKTASTKVIQGGIKDEASLNPSVKVIDGRAQNLGDRSREFNGQVEQYNGSTYKNHGSPFPSGRRTPEFGRRSHLIRPITDYTLRPSTKIMSVAGSGVMVAPSYRVQSFHSSGSSVVQPRSRNGITTFYPGYETSKGVVNVHESIRHLPSRFGSIHSYGGGGRGVTTFMPGYATGHLSSQSSHTSQTISSNKGITAWVPGYSVHEPPTTRVDTVSTPASTVSRITYRKGVSTWTPGYQVTVSTNNGYKTSLGGKWFEPESKSKSGPGVKAESMSLPRIYAQPVVADGPLLAKANLLPQLRNGGPLTKITWKDWFNIVASSIYSHWQAVDVGPGTARVSVTITSKRDINAQVEDFMPAAYVDRDVDKETEFKVAALNSVLKVDKREIPRFPPLSDKDSVTFSVMLERTVNGPIGIDMSKLHVKE